MNEEKERERGRERAQEVSRFYLGSFSFSVSIDASNGGKSKKEGKKQFALELDFRLGKVEEPGDIGRCYCLFKC